MLVFIVELNDFTPYKDLPKGIPMTDVKTITIDDKEYVLEDLSEAARAQLVSLQVTDQEIIRLAATTENCADSSKCIRASVECGAAQRRLMNMGLSEV